MTEQTLAEIATPFYGSQGFRAMRQIVIERADAAAASWPFTEWEDVPRLAHASVALAIRKELGREGAASLDADSRRYLELVFAERFIGLMKMLAGEDLQETRERAAVAASEEADRG